MMLRILLFTVLFFSCLFCRADAQEFRKRLSQASSEEIYKTEDDIKAEIIFGEELSARILGTYPLLKDSSLTEYVNLVGKALSHYAGRPEIEFHFGILDTDHINALSAPGGYVFITRGALQAMEDESELAGVLAHEIAHVTERHIVKEINLKAPDESPVTGLASLISGATGGVEIVFSAFIDKAYEILFERGYKREDEFSSDIIATTILHNAGYDPEALLRFLKRLQEKGHLKDLKGTHPGASERIDKLEQFLKENQLAGKDYQRLKERFYERTKKK